MTLDAGDGRTCRVCGAVIGDRLLHARHHRDAGVIVDALESVRSLLVAFEAELSRLAERDADDELSSRRRHPSGGA